VRAKLIPEFLAAGSHRHDFVFTPKDDPFQSLYESLIGRDKVGPDKNYCFSESKAQFVLEGEPKDKPDVLAQVARQLKDKDAEWLIFIDQFEELFTRCINLEQRKNFIQSIAQIATSDDRSVKIVLAMRADFLGEFNPYPKFGKTVQRQIHLVNEMPEDELELAIKGPAAKHGVRFEPGLAKEIISDVQGQAGSLPLMQYTLDRLWQYEVQLDKLADRMLNTQHYQALGKVRGALEQHVNEIYGSFSTIEQQATKRIFLSLVKVFTTEGVEKRVSQSVARSQLQGAAVPETINRLINENLLVSSSKNLSQAALSMQNGHALEPEATIEMAHEILLTSWTKLQDWIEESQTTLLIKSRLVEDMERWHKQKQAHQELLKSSVLAKVLELKEQHLFELQSVPLSAAEEVYIEASQRFQQQELNRARRVAIGASMGAVLMACSTFFALYQLQHGQRQQVEQLATTAETLTVSQPVNAVIYAIAAKHLSQSVFVQFPDHPQFSSVDGSLMNVILINREQNRLSHSEPVHAVTFSPDGRRIVSGSWSGEITVWDAKTGEPIGKPLTGHEFGVDSVAFSLDGQRIFSSDERTVKIWDANTGALIDTPWRDDEKVVASVTFSPDGQRIVSGGGVLDNTVRIWDTKTGAPIGNPLRGHEFGVFSIAFSPDGQRIVSGGGDNTVRIWDAKTGAPIGNPLRGHEFGVFSIAFSPDGQRIVSGGRDNTVRIWDAKTGAPIGKPLLGHEDAVTSIAFSPDGQRIVSSSSDNTVRIWDAKTESILSKSLTSSTDINSESFVTSLAFGPDGQSIVSGSTDGALRVWNAKTGMEIGKASVGNMDIRLAFSPDGEFLVIGDWEGTLPLWNAKTGKPLHKLLTDNEYKISSVAFSPDGQHIAASGGGKIVWLWDTKTGKALHEFLTDYEYGTSSVAFSPNGHHVISGGGKTVHIWDVKTGAQVGKTLTDDAELFDIRSVAFSPDGQLIVTANGDANTVKIWDVKTGTARGTSLMKHAGSVNSVVFSPDGQRIISGSAGNNTVRIWDISWQSLLERGCTQLRYHPSLSQPTTDVAREAKQTCEQYVWKR